VARVLRAGGVEDVYRAMMAAENDAGSLVPGSTGRSSDAFAGAGVAGRSGFEQAMLMDTSTYLPDDLLTKVDRASMAVSLEVRVPLLDPTLFEFAWGLHPTDRVRDGNGKWVLRRLLHRYVPPEMVERPKMGFGVPVGAWLRGPLRAWADELLEPSLLAEQGHLDPAGVTARWRAHRDLGDDLIFQLWPILMFQAWLQEVRP
jgi:asparagine synthase (glutamine-hydrolysing)